MSTTTVQVTSMADPNDVGTVAGIIGGAGVIGMGLLKAWQQYFSNRAEVASSKAQVDMLEEYKVENERLRVRNDTLSQQNATLMQENYMNKADLKSALDKIEFMAKQMEDMKTNTARLEEQVSNLQTLIREGTR